MSDQTQPEVGSVTWTDITVDNADELKDFYSAVIVWKPDPIKMGNYSDYAMFTPSGSGCVAGICHARGVNYMSKVPASSTCHSSNERDSRRKSHSIDELIPLLKCTTDL